MTQVHSNGGDRLIQVPNASPPNLSLWAHLSPAQTGPDQRTILHQKGYNLAGARPFWPIQMGKCLKKKESKT